MAVSVAGLPGGADHRAVATDRDDACALALGGGDDYELCFTAPPRHGAAIAGAAADLGLACTRIGRVLAGQGVECAGFVPRAGGYQHFRGG